MKRPKDLRYYRSFLFAAGALVALFAAAWFFDRGRPVPAAGTAATSSFEGSFGASLSADALPEPAAAKTPGSQPAAVQARAAAAMDLETGTLLYVLQPDLRWPIASITKLMTAQIILDRMDPDARIVMAPSDFSAGGSGLSASLEPGDQYRAEDLLRVLLLPSSNEAAEAFARTYGRDAFLAAMNSKAAEWGLLHTHFDDPSGLSAANQSTPRELLQLVRRIRLAHPEIFAVTRARTAAVTELSSGALKQFPTTNEFAGRADFLGGKTGTTPEAGDNLVSVFQAGGRIVATVVFGAADRYAATESLLQLIP